MQQNLENYAIQKKLVVFTILLFILKAVAWAFTHSVAILTDTLEYTINVVGSLIGLYSLYLSSLPKDYNHPYGHGKVEFLSAGIEGLLMIISSFLIIYEAFINLRDPHPISKLDYGIILLALSGLLNYLAGAYAIRKGRLNNSMSLHATGKHMQSDTYATIGIVIGLVLMYFTQYRWIDSVMAIIFALIILFSGYKILRGSIAGIMDEADADLLEKLVATFQHSRQENWIDLHNLRVIKYGGSLHLDLHLTVPWYLNVHEAHREIDALSAIVTDNFGERVEMFVHTDGCLNFSCAICTKKDCQVRQQNFVKKIDWTVGNISTNEKHRVD